jgi:hypothetical protein
VRTPACRNSGSTADARVGWHVRQRQPCDPCCSVHSACRGRRGTMRLAAGLSRPGPQMRKRLNGGPRHVQWSHNALAGSHRRPRPRRVADAQPTPRAAALRLFGVIARQIHIMAAEPAGGAEAPAALGQPRIVAWSQHVVAAELAEAHQPQALLTHRLSRGLRRPHHIQPHHSPSRKRRRRSGAR